MSDIQNNQEFSPANDSDFNYGEEQEVISEGVSFKGEKTDLRYEPNAAFNKAWVNYKVSEEKSQIGDYNVSFDSKEIKKVQKDLNELNKNLQSNPSAVKRAMALSPAFDSYAEKQGKEHPHKLALALEHYAATNALVAEKTDTEEN